MNETEQRAQALNVEADGLFRLKDDWLYFGHSHAHRFYLLQRIRMCSTSGLEWYLTDQDNECNRQIKLELERRRSLPNHIQKWYA